MPMTVPKLLLLNVLGGGGAAAPAVLTITTTGAMTLSINELGVSAPTTVDWGDGTTSTYTGTAARSHAYAGAGTWKVRILEPLNVTVFSYGGGSGMNQPVGLTTVFNSADVKSMANLTKFSISFCESMIANSADFVGMSGLTSFFVSDPLLSGPYSGLIDLNDFAGMTMTYFGLQRIAYPKLTLVWRPAVIQSWTGLTQFLYYENVGQDYSAMTRADFAGMTACSLFYMHGNNFTQAQVDAILLGLNDAGEAGRTPTGGSIRVDSSNAKPSGTYAVEGPPIVSGLGAKYSLLNTISKPWATVTTTA